MKKWQELALNALLNFSVALGAGGVLKLILDDNHIISAILAFFFGIYLALGAILTARHIEKDI